MKKLIFPLLLSFLIFFSVKNVFADYATSYQSYINSNGIYQSAHSDYLIARANYLASGSIDAQDKAKTATLKMLQARDSLIISYLNAIKSKIQSTKGISSSDATNFSGRIDTEASWYGIHLIKLSSAGSLQDLVSDSDDAKSQYNSSTLVLTYQSLILLGAGNNQNIRDEINTQISSLKAKIDEIKANRDKDTSSIERSLVDVENKISRSQAKDSNATNSINSINPNSQLSSTFQSAQSLLIDSNLYLSDANQELLQIITQIKTAD